MADGKSIGERLRLLKERSGRSFGDIAADMGAKQRSSIQHFFDAGYRDRGFLDLDDAMRIGKALVGYGEPPISQDEILELTYLSEIGGTASLPVSAEVAREMAQVYAQIALEGRKPSADALEALTETIRGISVFYQHEPEARHDPGQTRGALRLLASRVGRQGPESPGA